MKRQVKDLITQKKLSNFVSVAPNTSIYEALDIMDESNCSALLVMDNDKLVGIFSEKDFAKACMRRGNCLSHKVASVMSSKIIYIEPTFTLEECLQVMSKVRIRHLPVLENGKPIVLLSMRHIVEALVDDKNAQIRELTSYITGDHMGADEYEGRKLARVPVYESNYKQGAI